MPLYGSVMYSIREGLVALDLKDKKPHLEIFTMDGVEGIFSKEGKFFPLTQVISDIASRKRTWNEFSKEELSNE